MTKMRGESALWESPWDVPLKLPVGAPGRIETGNNEGSFPAGSHKCRHS